MARSPEPRKGRKTAAPGRDKPVPVTIISDARDKPAIPESSKLSANYINGIAIGVFISGALVPSLVVIQAPGADINPLWLAVTMICTAASGALHLFVRHLLERSGK